MPPAPSAAKLVRAKVQGLDLTDPAVAADPFPHFEALRSRGPVQRLGAPAGWIVLGYDAAKEAMARPDLFSNAPYREVDAVLLGEDPPRQAAVRKVVARLFTADSMRRLEAVAERTARGALKPQMDAVAGFAQPVSRAVAADLIGFDAKALAGISAAADAAAGQPLSALIAALDAFGTRAAVYSQLLEGGEGLIGEAEARSLVRLLWLASNTTTERVISRCVLRLVEAPEVQASIRADRALLAPFIEEVMRLHAPEHILPRVAVADAVLGGEAIGAGEAVFVCVGAANRDPAHFHAPGRLMLEREAKRHFAFGSGIHHCVGAPLARRVVAAALGALLDGAPELRLIAEPESFSNLTSVSPSRLEIGL